MANQCLVTGGSHSWWTLEFPSDCRQVLPPPLGFLFSFHKGGGGTLSISSYKLLSYLFDNDKCSWCFFGEDGVINICVSTSLSFVRNVLLSSQSWKWAESLNPSGFSNLVPNSLKALQEILLSFADFEESTVWAKAVHPKPCELKENN